MQLSTVPTLVEDGLRPRHVDLRPFAVNDGHDVWVLPGGLTRVALPEGELVVNSSQGGGSKDTWVVGTHPAARVRTTAEHAGAVLVGAAVPIDHNPGDIGVQAEQQQQSAERSADAGDRGAVVTPC